MPLRFLLLVAALASSGANAADSLSAQRLGVLYNLDDAASQSTAQYYADRRAIPAANVVGVHMGRTNVLSPMEFAPIRKQTMERLPGEVQSLALVWSHPFAVGCMSITTAVAVGYKPEFCDPGCKNTSPNPLFDVDGWLPADTVGWMPAMLIPTADPALARSLIERGVASDGSAPVGALYLVRTQDAARNVRAVTYPEIESQLAGRARVVDLSTPITGDIRGAIGYFTGAVQVEELARIQFLPGAVADHLTSTGGVLAGGSQMPAVAWLKQGATASYGNVSEPCNLLAKFPNISVLMRHYMLGETVLEAYWKSVAMPGQGLFIGEPLAKPYATHRQ